MSAQPLLKAEGLTIAFSGVRAADNVSLQINEGELLAIIGPNGSGKTTFLNLCTGYVRPVSGEVYLDGKPITSMSPRSIARKGIARAFQIPQLFTDQRLIDNLMLALASRESIWDAFRPLDRKAYRDEAMELLTMVGLQDIAESKASVLPEGLRKLADVAIALALKPRLLLLDEPTSGVSSLERFELMETLMSVLKKRAVTALFVEHDMDVVSRYADRVLVWNSGTIMMEGDPQTVMNDPRVIENVIGAA